MQPPTAPSAPVPPRGIGRLGAARRRPRPPTAPLAPVPEPAPVNVSEQVTEESAPVHFRVVIEAPRSYRKLLEAGLDLVRWQRDARVTMPLLQRLVAEARKAADKLTKTLHECDEWERQTVLPLAQARIELDLDDGVKTNYLKLGEALAPIAGLAAKDDE